MTTAIAAVYKDERTWFYGLCMLLCALFALYAYFVTSSVVQVVMRKELDQEIGAQHSYISQLEAKYIAAQHEVSEDIATHEGFVPVTEKIFVSRAADTLVLSYQR